VHALRQAGRRQRRRQLQAGVFATTAGTASSVVHGAGSRRRLVTPEADWPWQCQDLITEFGFTGAVQSWQCPNDGLWLIGACGASGANVRQSARQAHSLNLGGAGAKVTVLARLLKGSRLDILVGEEGSAMSAGRDVLGEPIFSGSGGGASVVSLMYNDVIMSPCLGQLALTNAFRLTCLPCCCARLWSGMEGQQCGRQC